MDKCAELSRNSKSIGGSSVHRKLQGEYLGFPVFRNDKNLEGVISD